MISAFDNENVSACTYVPTKYIRANCSSLTFRMSTSTKSLSPDCQVSEFRIRSERLPFAWLDGSSRRGRSRDTSSDVTSATSTRTRCFNFEPVEDQQLRLRAAQYQYPNVLVSSCPGSATRHLHPLEDQHSFSTPVLQELESAYTHMA